jgi:hypothetical protein
MNEQFSETNHCTRRSISIRRQRPVREFSQYQTDLLKAIWKMRKHPPALNFLATLLGSLISGLFLHTRQIPGADENSSVRFCAAGKIFATGFLLDGRPVGFEYRQLVLAVSPQMVIQSLSAELLRGVYSNKLCFISGLVIEVRSWLEKFYSRQ